MKRLIALTLTVLLARPAHAEEGLKRLPAWHMVTLTGGQQKACYDIDGAKALLLADIDFDNATNAARMLREQVELLRQNDAALRAVKASLETDLSASLLRVNDLSTVLLAETARANKAEASKFPVGWIFAIGAGGILLGALVGVLLGVYVK